MPAHHAHTIVKLLQDAFIALDCGILFA